MEDNYGRRNFRFSIPEPKKLSMIERYGEDLTANTYVTNPAIAREEEIKK